MGVCKGNIKPIITAQYPACWKTYQKCAKTLTEAPDYTQVIGVGTHFLCCQIWPVSSWPIGSCC